MGTVVCDFPPTPIPRLVPGPIVLQLRMRVEWRDLEAFNQLYEEYFLPVDAVTRPVLRLYHHTRHHFNLTFLYRYESVEAWTQFHQTYAEAWRNVHPSKDEHHSLSVEEAEKQIVEKEGELAALVADDERLVLLEFEGNTWAGPAEQG